MILLHLSDYTDHITADGTELTRRPYPYGVDAYGHIIGRTDEVTAIGFQEDAAVQRVDLFWGEYAAGDPQVAVGKYLVTQDAAGRYATNVCAIESVEVRP